MPIKLGTQDISMPNISKVYHGNNLVYGGDTPIIF
jgi:hypothetical protein